jgi:small-conductance mechanosensitive channel
MNNAFSNGLEALALALMPWFLLVTQLPWISLAVQLVILLAAVMLAHHFATHLLLRITAPLPYSRRLVQYGHRAGAGVLYLLLAQVLLRNASDNLSNIASARHAGALALIAALTWLGLRCVRAIAHTIIENNPVDAPDNLQARRIQTQTKVLARSVMALIVLIGSGAAFSTLPVLRQIGTSLLASAGVAGLVVGFAAKPVLGNLLAGMQIALTQPIRLEDVVIVQNEWGQVEEITGTYVVVRIWDQRRMIVPLQWFIENPFQNWTRNNSEILGTVSIWVDYRMPVDLLRKEARRLCESAPEWDKRLCLTQVIEAGERSVQLRILVSAGDAGRAWDLRCRLREGLIDYVQRQHPEYLPRVRAEVTPDVSGREAGWRSFGTPQT